MKIKRGEIYLADLTDASGSEQSRVRPVVIIQNNLGNKHSPTTIVACLSSKVDTKAHLPTHYLIINNDDLRYQSMVMCEQIKVIDKSRLLKKITKLNKRQMNIINKKIKISLAINA
jgi:mRNA interferase MazF